MKDVVLNKLFQLIGFKGEEALDECKVTNVSFVEKTRTLEINLSFTNIPPVQSLYRMNKALKEGLVSIKAAKKVIINYDYNVKVLNETVLKEYYEFIIAKLSEKNFIYNSLLKFTCEYTENYIRVLVGDTLEMDSINAMLMLVNASFCALGIDFISIKAILNEKIDSIKKKIEDSFEGDLNDAISKNNSKPAKKEDKETTYKPVKNKSNLNGKPFDISLVPSTENELVEYKQKYGSLYFLIEGVVKSSNITVTPSSYRIYEGTVVDKSGSIKIKTFITEGRGESEEFYRKRASANNKVRAYGLAAYDTYSRDVVIKIFEIISYGEFVEEAEYSDNAHIKRVELHAHSKMTFLDSVLSIEDYVKRAKQYGHKAIALTDKNTVQGLGELNSLTKKAKIKPIYGIEAHYINEKDLNPAFSNEDIDLRDAYYTVLDFETTGINTTYNEIIEIGAVKVYKGKIIDQFSTFVNPRRNISQTITNLTTITNDDVRNAPFIEDLMPKFLEFIRGTIIVAQNAKFDIGHLKRNVKRLNYEYENYPVIDTMQIGRARYSHIIKKFNLEELCKAFNVTLETHHRAIEDTIATAEIFIKMLEDLINDGITNYNQINSIVEVKSMIKHIFRPSHITMLALNRTGLVNINRLVSDAHTNHIAKTPRFMRSVIEKHREGIIIGSGCVNGEVFETALNKEYDDLLPLIDFYDYIELQPLSCYSALVEKSNDEMTFDKIKNAINRIVKAAKEKGKIIVATGDVHELDPEHTIYRSIIYDKPLIGGGIHDYSGLKNLPKSHYRNTEEMLKEFEFLGAELAYEIVVTNTNKIADMVETYDLFPDKLFAPGDDFMSKFGVPSAIEDLKRITYETAKARYGENLPQIILDRLDKELGSIIKYKYGSIYYIAYLLVKHSRDAGYVVGSRGSVGSSLVATFMKITEVNSLAPHYVCPHCKFSAFKYTKDELEKYTLSKEEADLQEFLQDYDSGLDLPKKKCPICGEVMEGDGVNIPFETFLGFKGDKVPDIDLNFSGEYQARAHAFCREIFGVENTFRGGTIGTIAKRTAENYIKDYYVKRNKVLRNCEVENMTENIMGIKRQTGQHPGGIVVVPEGVDINEVTPVQFPADDVTSDWKTTHIDYHKFEANLLKLDILGHDDPTMMKYLMNFVEEHPEEFPFSKVEDIPLNDENVLKMFQGIDILGVTYDQVLSKVGSTGLPEFGTNLTKDMCYEIKPSNISDLIRISGLSHGTMVWNGNEREYFLGKKEGVPAIPIKNLICCRDDIMETLIAAGLPSQNAFKIMESVRKGRGVDPDNEALMRKYNVPEWYIQICKDIQYLFPKAHATAYVIMALRIAWFKYYKPLYFYSGFFSKRTDFFEVQTLQGGYEAVKARAEELEAKYGNLELSDDEEAPVKQVKGDTGGGSVVKQKKLLVGLKVALEMMARGYGFIGVNINKSDAVNFKVEGNNLIIPFKAIDSFGENTAKAIVEKRGGTPFTSINEAMRRGHISNSLHDKLAQVGAFDGLPKEDKLGIFQFIDDKKE